MNVRLLFASAKACTGIMCSAVTPQWQDSVDKLIAHGEFAKAEKLMKSLPSKERKNDAVRIDSLKTIMQRIRNDFTITPEQGCKMIRERMPSATDSQIENWKNTQKLEVMNIDGQEWWFRKSIRNLWLLADEFAEEHAADKNESYDVRRKYFLDAMKSCPDANNVRNWTHVNLTFTLDVDADAVPAGEKLRVWMPFPYENVRQRNIKMESSNRDFVYSEGSKHHTVYMEAIAEKGKPTHFEYTFSYEVGERHISKQDMLALLEPYNKNSETYKRFTMNEPPHMTISDAISKKAKEIVGDETNPIEQASKIYMWISRSFPWAGAREYSTIPNMADYVVSIGHGDCGQVALLYISLCRSLGIPARWESGWFTAPGEVGWHDWAETYFEGIGWVSTDPSFGRNAVDTPMADYYTSGLDIYRLATNETIGDVLSPAKTFIRSETVDFQAGEVEWKGGNLFYDKWDSNLKVNSYDKCNQ
ncbi:MAG: transglutaminase domain-containing protein [Bacteroidales bacterium]|nr:transglutaminase domain-containing protein [Candidatus Sodaliphilus aphodohippi]